MVIPNQLKSALLEVSIDLVPLLQNTKLLYSIVEARYPDQLSDIHFMFVEDPRFLKHAIANITWARPNGTNKHYIYPIAD